MRRGIMGTSRRHLGRRHWTKGWHAHPSGHTIRDWREVAGDRGPPAPGQTQFWPPQHLAEREAPASVGMGENVNEEVPGINPLPRDARTSPGNAGEGDTMERSS